MSHSRTGLNAPFYEWIDEVRRAFRKEKELLGKLEYYNVKFIGYKGINYGQIITNPMPSNDKDMLYWLDKIDETERKLKKILNIQKGYINFCAILSSEKCKILNDILNNSNVRNLKNKINDKDYAKFYKEVNKIIRDWNQYCKQSNNNLR
jgi:hypothetical protein